MKKIILTICVIVFCFAFASVTFAGSITSSTTIGGGTYAPSKNVTIKIFSSSVAYAAGSAHLNGSYEYCTVGGSNAGDPTKIYKKASTSTTASSPSGPTSATAACSFTTE